MSSSSSSTVVTRTIELPEELAARLAAALGPEEVQNFAVAVLEEAAGGFGAEPDAEMLDALREYQEDVAAGRFYPIEHLDAQIEKLLGRPIS